MFLKIKLYLILISVIAVASTWQKEVIDFGVQFNTMSNRSLVIDKLDLPHIVYGEKHLYHTWYDGLQWQTEIIDTSLNVGEYASLVIDGADTLHISYYDSVNQNLKYAKGTAGNWTVLTVDATDSVGRYNSIALDSNANAYIAYTDLTNHTLKLALDGIKGWSNRTIDANSYVNNSATSIILDPSNHVHITYGADNIVKYASNIGFDYAWILEDIDTTHGTNLSTSIALKSNDEVYVAYLDSENSNLKVAHRSSLNQWETTLTQTASAFGALSLAIDTLDTLHISYLYKDVTGTYLKYLTHSPTHTAVDTIAMILSNSYSSLALDSNNNISVAYQHTDNQINLYYGINLSRVLARKSDMGKHISVATDTNGYLHVSYTDDVAKSLRYATNAPFGIWSTQTIDTANIEQTSIAVTNSGIVHLSYYDSYLTNLKYTYGSGNTWTITSHDSNGDVGDFCDIALDNSEHVHISYYDRTNGNLKYTTNVSGSWQSEIVESIGDTGLYTSIAVDNANTVHILFAEDYGSSNHNLLISGIYDNWNNPFFPENYSVTMYNSLAIDSDNNLHIGYFGLSGADDLRYINKTNSQWGTVSIIENNFLGSYPSITVDSTQNAYITYYDKTNKDAKFATNATGSWTTESIASSGNVGEYTSIALGEDNTAHVCYYNTDTMSLECASKTFNSLDNALSSFYLALDGDNWNNNSGWLSSEDKCNWYGITCNSNGNIISIALESNNLSGVIPSEIEEFRYLDELNISNNHFSDINHLSKVTSLSILNLASNDITYLSPLSNLHNLKTLILDYNNINDLSALSGLTQLQNLSLLDNWDLTNISPLASLHNMKNLSLIMTSVSDISALSQMPNLVSFNHKGSCLSDISPLTSLSDMNSLGIWLCDNVVSIEPLKNMHNMKSLYIGSARGVTDISHLQDMSVIETLSFKRSILKNLTVLSKLNTLTDLRLSYGDVREISILSELPLLTKLDIDGNYIRDISVLASLPLLDIVYLEGNCITDFTPVASVRVVSGGQARYQRDPAECMPFNPAVIIYLLN